MITMTVVVLGQSTQHALALAKQIRRYNGGQLTTLVDGNRVYCLFQFDLSMDTGNTFKGSLTENILAEISARDIIEKDLMTLGCPFTFIDECDTDDSLTLEDMKTCDGSDELLVQLFELESLRDALVVHKDTFKYAAAIDALLPYIKKSLFSKGIGHRN